MGSVRGGGVVGSRRPSQTAYFVALGGILVLLAMLCCYFVYFCVKRVKELTRDPASLQPVASTSTARTSYPIQRGVRESATAMAKLCKQVPPAGAKGDTVFPTSTSPAATQADAAGDSCNTTLGTDKVAPLVGDNKCEPNAIR